MDVSHLWLSRPVKYELVSSLLSTEWRISAGGEEIRFDLVKANDIVYSLYPNLIADSDRVRLAPAVSVRSDLASQLYGLFFELYGTAAGAIGSTLSELLSARGIEFPETRWLASSEDDIKPMVARFCSDVAEFGLPFVQPYTTLSDIIEYLIQVGVDEYKRPYLAVMYAVDGRLEDALEELRHVKLAADQEPPLVSSETNCFINNFLRHYHVEL